MIESNEENTCLDCGKELKEKEDTLCSECVHKDDGFYDLRGVEYLPYKDSDSI